MKKLILSVFALAAIALSANAVETVSVQGTATLQSQITLSDVITDAGLSGAVGGKLQFGRIGIGTTASTVIVNPATGARTSSGTVSITSNDLAVSAAGYAVSGGNSMTYALTVPTSATLSLSGATDLTISSMKVYGKNAGATVDAGSIAYTLSAAGKDAFAIGGTLEIPSNATAGAYVGNFDVTVAYN